MIVWAVAALLGCSGAVAIAIGIADQDPAPSATPDNRSVAASPSPRPEPQSGDRVPRGDASDELDYSAPVRITIPSIGVSSELVDLGLDAAGVMETPQPVDKAGWFSPSPPPGIPGATVIAGHVTWDQEPMVFFELGELRPGDRVEVLRQDGATTIFEVTRIGSFPKSGFPTKAVYTQPERSELRLITCGGEYDEAAGRYLANVIVWARLVDVRPAAA